MAPEDERRGKDADYKKNTIYSACPSRVCWPVRRHGAGEDPQRKLEEKHPLELRHQEEGTGGVRTGGDGRDRTYR